MRDDKNPVLSSQVSLRPFAENLRRGLATNTSAPPPDRRRNSTRGMLHARYSQASNACLSACATSCSIGRQRILVFRCRKRSPRPPFRVGVRTSSSSLWSIVTHLAKSANASYDRTPAAFAIARERMPNVSGWGTSTVDCGRSLRMGSRSQPPGLLPLRSAEQLG